MRGELKVRLLSSDRQRLKSLRDCYLTQPDEKSGQPVRITAAREVKGFWLISLLGVNDREQAEKLRGCLLSVDRDQAIKLKEDEWFVADLLGCEVYDSQYGYLGHLADILQYPAQDIYIVAMAGCKDILFPARKTIIIKVDLAGRRIDVDLPPGLYEVYRETEKL